MEADYGKSSISISICNEGIMEKCEQETTITYDMEEQVVNIFTAIRRDIGKLKRAGITPTYGTTRRGFGYKVPLSRFKWRIAATTPSKRGLNLRNTRYKAPNTSRNGIPGAS